MRWKLPTQSGKNTIKFYKKSFKKHKVVEIRSFSTLSEFLLTLWKDFLLKLSTSEGRFPQSKPSKGKFSDSSTAVLREVITISLICLDNLIWFSEKKFFWFIFLNNVSFYNIEMITSSHAPEFNAVSNQHKLLACTDFFQEVSFLCNNEKMTSL